MKGGVHAWLLCLLLFCATTLNYLDRQTLSILAPSIQQEMRLNNEHLGWLFSVFYWTYTVAQFAVGLLLDRWNLRWVYGIAVLAWSAAAGLTGTAAGFGGLLFFRLLLGLTESANWPAAMRVVARALPPRDRALGNGLFTSGTSIGALIAPALILGISARFGWRLSFVAVASLGAVWFLVWILYTRLERFGSIWREEKATAAPVRSAYREILRTSQFWRVFAVTILVNPCLYFQLNWLPVFLVQTRGVTQGSSEMVWILTAIFIGLDLGYLSCGVGVLALVRLRFTLALARIAMFTLATLLVGLCAAAPFVETRGALVSVLVLVNYGIGIWIAMYLTMAQEVAPRHVSTAAGLLGGSGSAAGALAMWAVGRVTRQTESFAWPMIAVAVAMLIAWAAGIRATRAQDVQDSLPGSA
jgi:ACS family hexuronate transporter-like MFS transporter